MPEPNRKTILAHLREQPEMLKDMDILGPEGQVDERGSSKLREVAGFSEVILRYVRKWLGGKEKISVLECSCGKSYLGFALAELLDHFENTRVELWGVDSNPDLITRCRDLSEQLALTDVHFVSSRTVQFDPDRSFDLVIALHACDTATDEAIAKGIQLGCQLILTVPCCQNQIRGQIKSGHPLTAMTDFGPVRYRLANLLTDTLRAQFLRSAGYHVELDEISSPKLTPKNLCICGRKVKRRSRTPRDREYRQLRDMFDVKPAIEKLLPEIIDDFE